MTAHAHFIKPRRSDKVEDLRLGHLMQSAQVNLGMLLAEDASIAHSLVLYLSRVRDNNFGRWLKLISYQDMNGNWISVKTESLKDPEQTASLFARIDDSLADSLSNPEAFKNHAQHYRFAPSLLDALRSHLMGSNCESIDSSLSDFLTFDKPLNPCKQLISEIDNCLKEIQVVGMDLVSIAYDQIKSVSLSSRFSTDPNGYTSAGIEGLFKAARRYDPISGYRFSSYARSNIVDASQNHFHETSVSASISRATVSRFVKDWDETKSNHLSVDDVHLYFALNDQRSLDCPGIEQSLNSESHESTYLEVNGQDSFDSQFVSNYSMNTPNDPEKLASSQQVLRIMKESIEILDEIKRKVITRVFFAGLTTSEVAAEMGIETYAAQHHMALGMKRVRQYFELYGFDMPEDFIPDEI